MITYNGLDLFSSGPSAIEPGPLESRDAVAEAPGAVGASVITQGTAPRLLRQQGTLIADNAEALRALIDAIQAQVGLGDAALVDPLGRTWAGCLMQRFESPMTHRLGPRLAAPYEITYLQAQP